MLVLLSLCFNLNFYDSMMKLYLGTIDLAYRFLFKMILWFLILITMCYLLIIIMIIIR